MKPEEFGKAAAILLTNPEAIKGSTRKDLSIMAGLLEILVNQINDELELRDKAERK
jgi:hypothetical protein